MPLPRQDETRMAKIWPNHRDYSIHIERECLAVSTFAKLGYFVRQFFYFFTTPILGAVAADLLYKSVPGLCLIISRAARYLPKPALNNIPSLCVYNDLYGPNLGLQDCRLRRILWSRAEVRQNMFDCRGLSYVMVKCHWWGILVSYFLNPHSHPSGFYWITSAYL